VYSRAARLIDLAPRRHEKRRSARDFSGSLGDLQESILTCTNLMGSKSTAPGKVKPVRLQRRRSFLQDALNIGDQRGMGDPASGMLSAALLLSKTSRTDRPAQGATRYMPSPPQWPVCKKIADVVEAGVEQGTAPSHGRRDHLSARPALRPGFFVSASNSFG